MRRTSTLIILGVVALAAILLPANAQVPDPSFIEQIPGARCKPANPYEKRLWRSTASAQGGKKCKRMTFSYGPITVKPGQNDVLLGPVTIEKPAYDGYITRFQPDLVDESGVAPPIDVMHL